MSRLRKHTALAAAAALSSIVISAPASAGTGCNDVVNNFVWGCAEWNSNNGPQYPYYRKKTITIPKQGTQITTKDGRQYAVRGGITYPLIGTNPDGVGPNTGSYRVITQ